jgi:hypothetical protein
MNILNFYIPLSWIIGGAIIILSAIPVWRSYKQLRNAKFKNEVLRRKHKQHWNLINS